MNIVLMGLRGSGKTTIGRLLSQRLSMEFVDLDDLTARVLGTPSVAEAWSRHGEAAFRRAEVGALTELLESAGERLIALGGGTPTASGVADLLSAQQGQQRLQLVYLAAEPDVLRERLEHTDMSARPSLTGADPLREIDTVHARRDPLYRRLADEVIDTDELSIDEVVEAVAGLIG